MLLGYLFGVRLGARQPHQQVRAEPERPVVPAVGLGGREGEASPLWELRFNEPGHQGGINLHIGSRAAVRRSEGAQP